MTLRDNTTLSRFELDGPGATAVLTYRLADGVMTLQHTETPPAARGHGLASLLVQGALENAKSRGLKVVPVCSFVRAYVAKHPEYRDLVAT